MTGPQQKPVEANNPSDLDYCRDLVANSCAERLISLGYAPKQKRPVLLALYGFHAELQAIPFAVSEPPLGEIRLQWWRDALAEIFDKGKPRAHPVVQLLAQTIGNQPALRPAMDAALNATSFVFNTAQFTTTQHAMDFFIKTEGYIAGLAGEVLRGDAPQTDYLKITGALDAMARLLITAPAPTKGLLIRSAGQKYAALAQQQGPRIVAQLSQEATDAVQVLSKQPSTIMPAMVHFTLIKPRLARAGALANGAPPKPESSFASVALRWRIFWAVLTGRL